MRLNTLFNIKTEADFLHAVLEVFAYQFEHNAVYRSFCDLLYKHPSSVHTLEDIPFLPIEFFKSRKVVAATGKPQAVFASSGTTGAQTSKHYVVDLGLYERSFETAFQQFYGRVDDCVVLGLLPSYLERGGSSLVYMVNRLIAKSEHPQSGFYLDRLDDLADLLNELDERGEKTLLIGVSFALLDLVEKHRFSLRNTLVMETGGMKGRRKELIRSELHQQLQEGFGVPTIHSEYGMTELLSQAYSKGRGIFECPPWMRILTREPEDAFAFVQGRTGGINVIDLANLYSCSFIATQDLGRVHPDYSFEVLGRFDNSDIRGCNLMV